MNCAWVPLRVIVCGSRGYDNEALFVGTMRHHLIRYGWSMTGGGRPVVLVHGGCLKGPDLFAEQLAKSHQDITCERHFADWETHGRAAGPRRNADMVKLGANLCMAFWDGESRGTLDCITRCTLANIPVLVTPRER